MNFKKISPFLGPVLLIEGILMLPAAVLCLVDGDISAFLGFFITLLPLVIVGYLIFHNRIESPDLFSKDGMVIVSVCWIAISLFGALPLFISGVTPSFIDAFFEIVSGFTTTGASILNEVENLPRGILYWRSFTNWLGGMGVLVFFLAIPAILKRDEGTSMRLMEAESPGPQVGKLVPTLRKTARILYLIYSSLTLILFITLVMLKMPIFDALLNSFAAAGTGGFAIKNIGIAAYTHSQQTAIACFLLLFGVNFNIYYLILLFDFKKIFINEELKLYIFIIIFSTALITINTGSLHNAFFTVSSILTSTGFAINDYNLWPSFSKFIVILLMVIGGCAGSTAGGIKVSRVVLLLKQAKLGIKKQIAPRVVMPIKMDKEKVADETIFSINSFFTCYILIFLLSVALVSLDGYDIETSFTAVLACIGNTGPGLGLVGPASNFGFLSNLSKIVLSFDMLFGRLEIFPLVILFSPRLRKDI